MNEEKTGKCLQQVVVVCDPRINVSTKTSFFLKPRKLVSTNLNEYTVYIVAGADPGGRGGGHPPKIGKI